LESKRSAGDQSNFHYDSKYINSVDSVLDYSYSSKNIDFIKIEELVAEKWKKKEQNPKRSKQPSMIKKNSKQMKKRKNKLNINKMRNFTSQKAQMNSKYII